MRTLFSFLNLAAIFAGILSFIVGLYSLPTDKRRAVKFFAIFFIVLVVVGFVFFYGSELFSVKERSLQGNHAELPKNVQAGRDDVSQTDTSAVRGTQVGPKPRMASIQAVVYSRSKDRWGGSWMGQSFPDINLVFSSGLIVAPSDIRWKASYRFENGKVCLTISNLAVPSQVPIMEDYHRDF